GRLPHPGHRGEHRRTGEPAHHHAAGPRGAVPDAGRTRRRAGAPSPHELSRAVAGGRQPQGGRGAFGMVRPLPARDFRLLWTGMTASLLGDGVFLVALAWQVYELSDSPAALALVGLAASLPH